MAVIDAGIQQLLGQIFNEEIGSESEIREMMRDRVLSLPVVERSKLKKSKHSSR